MCFLLRSSVPCDLFISISSCSQNKYLVFKGPLGNMFAKTTVTLVQNNLLSFAALVDAGLDTKSLSRKINRTCSIQGQDGGNTSAESRERTRWTSHRNRLRRP